MLPYLWILAEADVATNTGLGPYTAIASFGAVGIIGILCLTLVTHTIPSDRKAERTANKEHTEALKAISEGHDLALHTLGEVLRDAIRESGSMFATTLREYREEQARRDDAERTSRDVMLKASDDKVERLAGSFQDLALSLSDVMQAMSMPNHSGILRRRRQPPKDKESVLE